jgi:hypothetical protein
VSESALTDLHNQRLVLRPPPLECGAVLLGLAIFLGIAGPFFER